MLKRDFDGRLYPPLHFSIGETWIETSNRKIWIRFAPCGMGKALRFTAIIVQSVITFGFAVLV